MVSPDSAKLTQAVEHTGRTYDEIGEMFAEQVIKSHGWCSRLNDFVSLGIRFIELVSREKQEIHYCVVNYQHNSTCLFSSVSRALLDHNLFLCGF